MRKINIRKAIPQEVGLIASFQITMAEETENIQLDPDIINTGVQAVFTDPSKGSYYLAEAAGEIVACMLTTYEWSDWRNGTFIWLQSVYVRPEWRGQGVFRNMFEYMKAKVSEDAGLKGIRLYVFHKNKSAQAVYRSVQMEDQHYRMYEWVKA